MQDEYEDEVMSPFGEQIDIILLEPWGGKNIGDIVPVYRGMYNTLIDLKKGIPVEGYNDSLTNEQRLVINAKNLEEENEELFKYNKELRDKITKLEKRNVKKKTKKKTTSKKKTTKELS